MKRTLLLLVCLLSCPALADFPKALTEFSSQQSEVQFTGRPGHWDAKIRERGFILHEPGGLYKMWYTGYDGGRDSVKNLGYAVSPDGINWSRLSQPLRNEWIEDVYVVKHQDRYHMLAEDRDDHVIYLTSSNGIDWSEPVNIEIRTTKGEALSDGPYGTPTFLRKNHRWYLFYERQDLAVWLAASTDLLHWTNVDDDPVLELSDKKHESVMLALNQVFPYEGRYYVLYHATGDREKPRTWTSNIAVSKDLLHWTKFDGNPILPSAHNRSSPIFVNSGGGLRLYTTHDSVQWHRP